MKKYLLILIAFLVITPACKYDEGPFISIYSKNERIMGNKTFKKVLINGENKTEDYKYQAMEFTKTGSFIWMFYMETGGYDYGNAGTWELIDKKETIVMETFESEKDTSYVHTWEIMRLTYADMILERTDKDGNKIRWELYQAY